MEWIDVTKELPKSKEHVLTCSKEWGTMTGFYDGACWRDTDWNDTYGYAESTETVTHWMPFPAPPYDVDFK